MQFTIDNIKNGNIRIYLQGDRDNYIKESLAVEDDYVWDDMHWVYIDNISIHPSAATFDNTFYEVIEWINGEGYNIGEHISPIEVVNLVNKLCNGRQIETIRPSKPRWMML